MHIKDYEYCRDQAKESNARSGPYEDSAAPGGTARTATFGSVT